MRTVIIFLLQIAVVFVLLFLLLGCTHTPVEVPREPITVPVRIEVPVREKCHVEVPKEPSWQSEQTSDKDPPFHLSKSILAELEQARAYIARLKAEAMKCE